jgi:hypothetical protein
MTFSCGEFGHRFGKTHEEKSSSKVRSICDVVNPLALELDISILTHSLYKM